jgi:DNA-3-methyladenine glycosylase I
MTDSALNRCPWSDSSPLMQDYHDREWGVPLHDDARLFELLVLEGAQAGLSWSTILNKREAYRAAFDDFDPDCVARYEEADIARLLANPGIVRNRRKILSAISNAGAFLEVQEELGSFDRYLWRFVGGVPLHHRFEALTELPATTPESAAMSQDLIRRGFRFVGPTICYAFMQSAGLVNDHLVTCFRHAQV